MLLSELKNVVSDIIDIQKKGTQLKGRCDFTEGSVLFEIPKMESNTIDGVITSPPYCNRYDYTRTYAMELAYLGKTDANIRALRQELLSCTVENKTKIDRLHDFYQSIDREDDYNKILSTIRQNRTLQEVNAALHTRAFVNDNVRYAGEVIPVDYLTTDLAEQLGFKAVKIYTLKQQKGNSSQQMAKYGRVALRKSITIWEKP